MVVHLPGGRLIAVDAKAPLVAHLDAEAPKRARGGPQRQPRAHVKPRRPRRGQLAGSRSGGLSRPAIPSFRRWRRIRISSRRCARGTETPSTLVALLHGGDLPAAERPGRQRG
jgi:hypothetical protein